MVQLFSEQTRKDFILAFYCLPAIMLIYVVGTLFFNTIHTSIAAGGAVAAGYGANKKLAHFPFAPMLIAVIGMGLMTYLGSWIGHYFSAVLCIGMLLATLCALVSLVDLNAWWIVLQWSISFFLASYYADNNYVALSRTGLVLFGGLFQTGCVMFLLRKTAFRRNIINLRNIRIIIHSIHKNIDKKIRFDGAGVYAALAMFICFIFISVFDIEYNYWASMTVLVILKPDFKNTLTRMQNRVIGTFCGILLANALTLMTKSPIILGVSTLVSLYFCYALCNQPYAILTAFITLSTVFMFSMDGAAGWKIAVDRVVATSVGGVSALFAMTIRSAILAIIRLAYKA